MKVRHDVLLVDELDFLEEDRKADHWQAVYVLKEDPYRGHRAAVEELSQG